MREREQKRIAVRLKQNDKRLCSISGLQQCRQTTLAQANDLN